MIAVGVRDQDQVDRAEPGIARARDGVAGVVEYAHAGRILEEDRPVLRAELAGALSHRRDLDVRGVGDSCTRPINATSTGRTFDSIFMKRPFREWKRNELPPLIFALFQERRMCGR